MVRRRTYCVDCHQFVPEGSSGSCKKYPWIISMKLAEQDKVCSYDSFKVEFFEVRKRKREELEAWKD